MAIVAEESEVKTVTYNGEEMTLEQATELERQRLEIQLCDRTEAVSEATAAFNDANEEAKERKKEMEARETMLLQTNRDLRLVLIGEWEPEKPDPQRELDFPEEIESAEVWKSKPVEELGLPKTINRELENEGFTTIGMMVREIDEGQGFYGCGNLTESQTGKILKAVAEFRANLDLGTKE